MKNLEYLWKKLEGTEVENEYLEKRFAEMSVKEKYILEGAVQIVEVNNASDLINLTEQLSNFDFYYKATDNKTLGEYVARHKECASNEILPFIKMDLLGREYHEDFNGVFTDNGYVYQRNTLKQIYDGSNLDKMTGDDWTVKIKVGNKDYPEGVWVNLPDYEFSSLEPDEMAIALDALGTNKWSRCALLDAKCIFPNIKELAEQYDSIEELISDGNNFGYACDEQGQGMPFFIEHLESAMELEGCTRLDFALDISQNLNCYDFAPKEEKLERYGRLLASKNGIVEPDTILGDNFDYTLYAKADIENRGLEPCKNGFIKSNGGVFHYEFSKDPNSMKISME
jgi:hypothetical protein